MENDRKDPGFSSMCLFLSIGYPSTLRGVPNKYQKSLMKVIKLNSPSKLTVGAIHVYIYRDRERVWNKIMSGLKDT
jgi:hypothetical protein